MRVGFVIYHDTTECEFVSVNECLGKVRQLGLPAPPENHVIGVTPEVVGWNGIVFKPHAVYREVDIDSFDLLVVPGGQASRTVRHDEEFMAWIRGRDREMPVAACCSGALILAEAGFLRGKRATTHALAFETLREYSDIEVVAERVVEDGNVITAGGIMAAFDLGLHLVEKFWGRDARRAVAHQSEYRDIQIHPRTVGLLPELDGWYRGGHSAVHARPADWLGPTEAD